MKKKIVIGTRGSQLALWQAYFTRDRLEELGHEVELKIIKTKGDKIQHLSFDKIEGKGFFTKEIETELLEGRVDLAVHSYKDLPTENPEGLIITANSYRANPFDCLVIHPDAYQPPMSFQLKKNAIVGTSSARRKAQLLAQRPDLQVKDIRGNVPTRVKKLEGEFDAVVLAAAGLERLNLDLDDYHQVIFTPKQMIPAASQGVLAFQVRENDAEMQSILAQLHDSNIEKAIKVERTILNQLGGGCHQPIGVFCEFSPEQKRYKVWVTASDDWRAFPKRMYAEESNADTIIGGLMTALNDTTPKRVFISRNLTIDSYFSKAMKSKNYELIGQSLIRFSPMVFDSNIEGDWLFFTSKNGIQHFFEQNPTLPEGIQLAALGNGTASVLEEKGYQVNFVGKGNDIPAIGQSFAEKVVGQKVVFPIAQNSLRSVQLYLEENAADVVVEDVVVYSNKAKMHFELPSIDILVFTSPMNVRAYAKRYSLQSHQTVVVIGSSTAKALEEIGCVNYRLAVNPDEVSLADCCW